MLSFALSSALFGCASRDRSQAPLDSGGGVQQSHPTQSGLVVYVRVAGVERGVYPWKDGTTFLDVMRTAGEDSGNHSFYGQRRMHLIHTDGTGGVYDLDRISIGKQMNPILRPGDIIDFPRSIF